MPKQVTLVRFYTIFLILFWALLTSNGCKDVKNRPAYTIGFSQCVGSDLWRKTMLEEMKAELSLHPGANFVYADAQGNSTEQVEQVKKMMQQGIDLLIISPNEAQPLTSIVEEAYNKGIPVVIIDRKTASSLYTAYVGADNYQLGKMAGEYVGSTLKTPVNLLEIMGLPGSSPAIERDRGFCDGIKKFPQVHIISKIYGDWLRKNAEDALKRDPRQLAGINAVFAHNDVMAAGAREVLKKLKPDDDVKVIGVDALPGRGGGLQMVADQVLNASLLYPTGGKEAIAIAFQILNKEPFSRENILQSLVIDSTNVQLMNLQWDKINRQQQDIEKQQALLAEQQVVYNGQQVVLNIIVISLVLAIVFGGLAFYSLMENRKINKRLEVKNAEILEQRNQLIEMSARAQKATESRLNFFTNVSHEFRTPLTLMLLPLQDMLNNEKLMAVSGSNIKIINQNANRLLKLVNQLIDYRKLEFDKMAIKASENNLVDFVREVTEAFRLHARQLDIQLSFVSSEKNIRVWFDVNMLDKVFFNLIANAIKFCNGDGKIAVIIHKNHDQNVSVSVEDNGIGMSAEDTALVFDQFYQADNAPVTGSGIGLSLSKEIVLFHRGQIEVKSKKWGGTTFTVTLPLGDSHLEPNEKIYTRTDWTDIPEKAKIYQADLERVGTINDHEETFIKPKDHSLLIVEDNADLLQYLADKLSPYFEIFTAANGNSAVTRAFEQVPDLIISDVVLPHLSGRELAEKLKSDIRTSHIPIILLTAQGSLEHQLSGIRSMADLYVTKPFNFDFLLANVENLIRNRIILKEHFISDISTTDRLPISKTLDKKFVNDFTGIVEQNLSNSDFSVDDICRLIGVSRIQLYRKVKALMGCSITDYILNRRLKKAKYLLNNESYTISEITYMVGFSNPNYFATVFKATYECTPSEFRKNKVPSK
jgi:signal transduction histidine kinase/AraC-like DNA-binding protein/CheY-like chemotaxis protein